MRLHSVEMFDVAFIGLLDLTIRAAVRRDFLTVHLVSSSSGKERGEKFDKGLNSSVWEGGIGLFKHSVRDEEYLVVTLQQKYRTMGHLEESTTHDDIWDAAKLLTW